MVAFSKKQLVTYILPLLGPAGILAFSLKLVPLLFALIAVVIDAIVRIILEIII